MARRNQDQPAQVGWTGLEIDEDMRFQRRDWTFERISWSLLALLVLAALLGAFSRGPLSKAVASDPDGILRITYDRFLRDDAASSIEIELARGATAGDQVELLLRGPMLRDLQLRNLSPEPLESRLAEDGWALRFPVRDRQAPSLIRMELRPETVGWLDGEIAAEGRQPVPIRAFVYP
ncbi:hypothetical protein [Arenibaculum pallidiluteum]|uniref:hypothetical protein n=1 Tax=Arenibaculum pallidiluteum TaxID=2812559 RepID=UPI001A96D058|nr:hypothetical protein [Arenibaculum pallidiluteum]